VAVQVEVKPFQLEGARCRLKFDPKELQQLLHQKLQERFAKNKKIPGFVGSRLGVAGRFVNIDEGNLALHIMCAFIGKPKISCMVVVQVDGDVIVQQQFDAATSGTCFSSIRALLKGNVNLLARAIVNRTVKALKARSKAA
jgi:hypothetical protein